MDIHSAVFFRMKDVIESGLGALLQDIELIASTTSPVVILMRGSRADNFVYVNHQCL